jgi:hypothetical protein
MHVVHNPVLYLPDAAHIRKVKEDKECIKGGEGAA